MFPAGIRAAPFPAYAWLPPARLLLEPVNGSQTRYVDSTVAATVADPAIINGPPPVGLPLRQKAKGGAAALEGRLAGVEWGVLAALGA